MSKSDTTADLLTKIRNGKHAKHRYVESYVNAMELELVRLLRDQGYIEGFLSKEDKGRRFVRIYLKYANNRRSVISGIRRISKPGCRRYVGYQKVPSVLGRLGIAVLSTPRGLMTGEQARREKVGGEIICFVW